MTITHSVTVAWAGSNGGGISGTITQSFDAERNCSLAIAGTTPDQQFDLDFLYAKLKSIFILATVAMTIETNAVDHAGGDIITLAANTPFLWTAGCGLANPFTANVTTIYVTPGGSVAGQLDIRMLIDSTT